MSGKSTYSLNIFDAIRARYPELAVNLYAMTPQGAVTLEVLTPDDGRHVWTAVSAEEAFSLAFPDLVNPSEPEPAPAAEPAIDIFG